MDEQGIINEINTIKREIAELKRKLEFMEYLHNRTKTVPTVNTREEMIKLACHDI